MKKVFMLSMCFIVAMMSVVTFAANTAPAVSTAKAATTTRTQFATAAHNYNRQVAAVNKLIEKQERAYQRLVVNQERAQANLINRQLIAREKAMVRLTDRADALFIAASHFDFALSSPGSIAGTVNTTVPAAVATRVATLRETLDVPAANWPAITLATPAADIAPIIRANLVTPGAFTLDYAGMVIDPSPAVGNRKANFNQAIWDILNTTFGGTQADPALRTPRP